MIVEDKLKLMEQALKDAYTIIDYSGGGDKWERECTEKERDRFYDICNKLGIGE